MSRSVSRINRVEQFCSQREREAPAPIEERGVEEDDCHRHACPAPNKATRCAESERITGQCGMNKRPQTDQ